MLATSAPPQEVDKLKCFSCIMAFVCCHHHPIWESLPSQEALDLVQEVAKVGGGRWPRAMELWARWGKMVGGGAEMRER